MANVRAIAVPETILIELRAYLASKGEPIAAILADTVDHYLSEGHTVSPQQATVLGDK